MVDVRLCGLGKRFGSTVVLEQIDADFRDGTFVVLVGRSGCGKSTLLRLIAGLEEASAGRVEFSGRDVTGLAPRDRDVAMVFQSYALYPHMTVRENLAFGLRLRKESKVVIDQRVAEVSKVLEIEHLLDRHPRALSGGQRQRVAMGRAIVRRPKLFLFDEPLSNLDPSLRTQVRLDIRRLHDQLGGTSIYVTHDQVEAMTLADVLVVLDGGRIQQVGAPLEVYRRPANRFVAGFLGSPAMNFLGGRAYVTDGELEVELPSGARIGVPRPESVDSSWSGRSVTVGVRPHDLVLAGQAPAQLELVVEMVETLGPSIHVHGRAASEPLTVALDVVDPPARGATLGLRMTGLHLFDPDSGNALT